MADVDVELGDVDMIQTIVQSLLDCVENEKNHTNKLPPTIYMVPSVFRDRSPISFNPRVVSIGPLHREDKKLQEFEVYKASSVHDLLHRLDSPPELTLQSCVKKVNDSIDRIRESYAGMMKTYSDLDLVKMMFTILKIGFEGPLSNFIFPVLKFLQANLDIENIRTDTTHDHILGLLHECYWPQCNISSEFSGSSIYSAIDLDRAGVNFKPNKYAKWSLAMEVKLHRFPFLSWSWAKPTLRMPVLHIHDYTELILRNLMAYEQSSLGCNFVTSYVIAMDMLVNSEEDIARLVKSKVLVNTLGSNDEAATMMNNICKEVAWIHFFYNEQWKKLDSYCKGYWPKNVALLRRIYFGSPWTIIALVAGIVLFGLTVVQTIFAIKAVVP